MAVRTPQFRTPFQIVGGAVPMVEQDSAEEIDQCEEAVLRTPEGARIEDPEFGCPDETFATVGPTPSAAPYVNAVEECETRSRVRGTAQVEGMVEKIVLKQESMRV